MGFERFEEQLDMESAITPLYPKLRLSAEDLISYAADFVPLLRAAVGASSFDSLRLEPFYQLGGDYLADRASTLGGSTRCVEMMRRAFLSRYVGVLRWHYEREWLLDLVLDTTDVRRSEIDPPVLMIVGATDEMAKKLPQEMFRTF